MSLLPSLGLHFLIGQARDLTLLGREGLPALAVGEPAVSWQRVISSGVSAGRSADDSSSTSSGEWYQNFQPPPQPPPKEQLEYPGASGWGWGLGVGGREGLESGCVGELWIHWIRHQGEKKRDKEILYFSK